MAAGSQYWHARNLARQAMKHQPRREQDEMVCKCGRRWPVGESHPQEDRP